MGISGENGVPDWSPRGRTPVEKTVRHPSWVISEALPRVHFALPARLGPKYTLGGGASEMTHLTTGGVPFSLLVCILWETSLAHRFQWKSPQSPKSAQNRGTPLSDQFFSKVAHLQTLLSPIFGEKKCGNPPSGPSARGENRTFFRKSPTAWSGKALPSKNRVV